MRVIPKASVARLSLYLRALETTDECTISSEDLAERTGGNPAQVRKDLSHLGSVGTRGIGYDVSLLLDRLRRELGLGFERKLVIIGAGNLGQALAGYPGFKLRGFVVVGVYDVSPELIGSHIGPIVVEDFSSIDRRDDLHRTIAVLAVPAEVCQLVTDRLVEVGVVSILNFAPTSLSTSPGVRVQHVDLATELYVLSHHLRKV